MENLVTVNEPAIAATIFYCHLSFSKCSLNRVIIASNVLPTGTDY